MRTHRPKDRWRTVADIEAVAAAGTEPVEIGIVIAGAVGRSVGLEESMDRVMVRLLAMAVDIVEDRACSHSPAEGRHIRMAGMVDAAVGPDHIAGAGIAVVAVPAFDGQRRLVDHPKSGRTFPPPERACSASPPTSLH